LKAAGIRTELDLRNEKINYKIREHSLVKTPVIAVVGRNEAQERKVALRRFGGQAQELLGLEEAVAVLKRQGTPPDLIGDQ
jgi:threonyl-tRNA synthetase